MINDEDDPDWTSRLDDILEVAEATRLWGLFRGEMEAAGTFSAANWPALRDLVLIHILIGRALNEAITSGSVSKPKRGNAKAIARVSPHVEVATRLGRWALALEESLGLSPSARNRAGKVKRPNQYADLPAARYLKSMQGDVVPMRRKGR